MTDRPGLDDDLDLGRDDREVYGGSGGLDDDEEDSPTA